VSFRLGCLVCKKAPIAQPWRSGLFLIKSFLGLDQMGRISVSCSPDKVGGGSKRLIHVRINTLELIVENIRF